MDLESIYRRTVFSWRDRRDSEMDNINFFSFYVFTVKAKYNLIIRPWISTQCGTTLSLECINRNVLLVDKWGHLYAGLCSHLHQSPLSGEQAFCRGRWGWRTQTTKVLCGTLGPEQMQRALLHLGSTGGHRGRGETWQQVFFLEACQGHSGKQLFVLSLRTRQEGTGLKLSPQKGLTVDIRKNFLRVKVRITTPIVTDKNIGPMYTLLRVFSQFPRGSCVIFPQEASRWVSKLSGGVHPLYAFHSPLGF